MPLLGLSQQRFRFGAQKFNGAVAGQADDVVAFETVGFVPLGAVAVVHGSRQAAMLQQLQRSINGGVPEPRVLLSHLLVQFPGGKRPCGSKKYLQNVVARSGMLEILTAKIILKDLDIARHEGTFGRARRRWRLFAGPDAGIPPFY